MDPVGIVGWDGRVIVVADRDEAHRRRLLHRFVQPFVTGSGGRIPVRQRSSRERIGPLLFDAAVGAHAGAGEDCDAAVRREGARSPGCRRIPPACRLAGWPASPRPPDTCRGGDYPRPAIPPPPRRRAEGCESLPDPWRRDRNGDARCRVPRYHAAPSARRLPATRHLEVPLATFDDLLLRRYPDPGALAYRGRSVHNVGISNFDLLGHPVEYRGRRTRMLEKAYVAAKNPGAMVASADGRSLVPFIDRIFGERRAADVKRLGAPVYKGGLVDARDDWGEVCIAAMDFFLRQRWQPGTPDADALAARPRPIVEWVNWDDPRWGVPVRSREGRNAMGLLVEVIAGELLDGPVAPGAAEDGWRERQEELVELLNSRHAAFAAGVAARPRQMSLF